ncbi:MAG: DUF4147 domain-containing protein [Trueperaceae bacterium]
MRRTLKAAFQAAVAAADPAVVLPPHLPLDLAGGRWGRVIVVGAGKAAEPMARAAVAHLQRQHPHVRLEGVVVAPHLPPGTQPVVAVGRAREVSVLRGAHPVPDEHGLAATRRVMQLVAGAGPGDLVVVLLSGGGSALLTAPAGVTLERKAALTRALLASGATIAELNTVRKHLSAVKGGRLAALAAGNGAEVLTLAVSDVAGDDASTIASGPTVPDPTTYQDALAVAERHVPHMTDVLTELRAGAAGLRPESPKPGDERLQRARYVLVADPGSSVAAAKAVLEGAGVTVVDLGATLEGEARVVGAEHATWVHAQLHAQVHAMAPAEVHAKTQGQAQAAAAGPVALLSGGELTVTLTAAGQECAGAGTGRGGPNGEYALGLVAALARASGAAASANPTSGLGGAGFDLYVLAADTDGLDGGGSALNGSALNGSELNGPELAGSELAGPELMDPELPAAEPAALAGAAGALFGPDELAAVELRDVERALEEHDSHGYLQRMGGLFVTGPTGTNVNDLRIVLLVPAER